MPLDVSRTSDTLRMRNLGPLTTNGAASGLSEALSGQAVELKTTPIRRGRQSPYVLFVGGLRVGEGGRVGDVPTQRLREEESERPTGASMRNGGSIVKTMYTQTPEARSAEDDQSVARHNSQGH